VKGYRTGHFSFHGSYLSFLSVRSIVTFYPPSSLSLSLCGMPPQIGLCHAYLGSASPRLLPSLFTSPMILICTISSHTTPSTYGMHASTTLFTLPCVFIFVPIPARKKKSLSGGLGVVDFFFSVFLCFFMWTYFILFSPLHLIFILNTPCSSFILPSPPSPPAPLHMFTRP
jgi:hypothetical protein